MPENWTFIYMYYLRIILKPVILSDQQIPRIWCETNFHYHVNKNP